MARPGRVGSNGATIGKRERVIVRRDQIADDGFGDPAVDVVAIIELCQIARALPTGTPAGMVLAGPEELARLSGGRGALGTGIMVSEGVNGAVQLGVSGEFFGEPPSKAIVGRDPDPRQAAAVKRLPQQLDPRHVVPVLVPYPAEIDVETVIFLCALNEAGDEVGIVLGEEFLAVPRPPLLRGDKQVGIAGVGKILVADPVGRPPLQDVEKDLGIAFFRLPHQPPLIAAVEVFGLRMLELFPGPCVTRLAPLGRIHVAADLHLEMLQPAPKFGLNNRSSNSPRCGSG